MSKLLLSHSGTHFILNGTYATLDVAHIAGDVVQLAAKAIVIRTAGRILYGALDITKLATYTFKFTAYAT